MITPVLAVVDDYQPFLEYLSTFLRQRGYEVRVYSSGPQIISAVRGGTLPDLVLLDIMMPGMDGLDTLRAIKEIAPSIPVIMLSARNQASTVVDAVRLGALDYLVKPDNPEGLAEIALEAAVKDALARLERVKQIPMSRDALHRKPRAAARMVRLDADVARAFPTDAEVNDALRRMMRRDSETL
jgi:CheY-like chemotaxis protein